MNGNFCLTEHFVLPFVETRLFQRRRRAAATNFRKISCIRSEMIFLSRRRFLGEHHDEVERASFNLSPLPDRFPRRDRVYIIARPSRMRKSRYRLWEIGLIRLLVRRSNSELQYIGLYARAPARTILFPRFQSFISLSLSFFEITSISSILQLVFVLFS